MLSRRPSGQGSGPGEGLGSEPHRTRDRLLEAGQALGVTRGHQAGPPPGTLPASCFLRSLIVGQPRRRPTPRAQEACWTGSWVSAARRGSTGGCV